MYCINAVVRSGGSRYIDDGPRRRAHPVMQETARPFEADDCGTADNAVRAIGRSGACGVVLHLCAGNAVRDAAWNEQETADGGSRPRHYDTTNESDTWRQTE